MASSGRYMVHSPSPSANHSSHIAAGSGMRSAASVILVEQEKYLAELLSERQKLSPFMPVLLHSYRLLNQEILRITTLLKNASMLDQTGPELGSPLTGAESYLNRGAADMNGWASTLRSERFGILQSALGHCLPGVVKKIIRMEIPADQFPNFNFVVRLLGPRGNFLKQVEATTGCRILIRGHGSIKDPTREEMMKGRPGYEHLIEPLHIIIEAELPVEIVDARLMHAHEIIENLLKPVDESVDFFKQQHQLREIAMLGLAHQEEGSQKSGSASPFHDCFDMKRAKTRG